MTLATLLQDVFSLPLMPQFDAMTLLFAPLILAYLQLDALTPTSTALDQTSAKKHLATLSSDAKKLMSTVELFSL